MSSKSGLDLTGHPRKKLEDKSGVPKQQWFALEPELRFSDDLYRVRTRLTKNWASWILPYY